MSNKKVLITGASGLLGSNTAAVLLERGYIVKVLLRKTSNTIAIEDLDTEIAFGDITDAPSVAKAVEGCDIVIHAAANTSQWGAEMFRHDAVNVQGTQNVLEAVERCGVERFIHVSTANTFAPGTLEEPGDERGAFSHQDVASKYIHTKYAAEDLILEAIHKKNVPGLIVNPTFMLGARDAKPSSGKMILYYLRNPVTICPPGGKNFVAVQDAAIAIANAIERGQVGERYLLAGENMNYATFFQKVADVTDRKKPTFTSPAWLLKSAGHLGDVAQRFLPQPISLTYANTSMLTIDNYYSPAKAIAELGMPQTPIADAIADAVAWFTRHDYI